MDITWKELNSSGPDYCTLFSSTLLYAGTGSTHWRTDNSVCEFNFLFEVGNLVVITYFPHDHRIYFFKIISFPHTVFMLFQTALRK